MKRLLFISAITLISAGTFAQGKSDKNKKEKSTEWRKDNDDREDDKKDKKDKKDKIENRRDDREDKRDDMKDRRDDRNEGRRDDNRSGKYSKNTPRKVGDAFRRDFPNATNVSWTKNEGVWTASFNGGGLLSGNKTVSYRANGERVNLRRTRTGIFN